MSISSQGSTGHGSLSQEQIVTKRRKSKVYRAVKKRCFLSKIQCKGNPAKTETSTSIKQSASMFESPSPTETSIIPQSSMPRYGTNIVLNMAVFQEQLDF